MPDNIQSAVFEILKRIQTDVSDLRTSMVDVKKRQDQHDERMSRIEDMIRKSRRDSAAMLVMMRGTVGVFDERMTDVEEDVRRVKEKLFE
jgi:hypothetical protein